jgi:hypothetical protein
MYQVKDGGREWTGRFASQAHAESRGVEGGGRVSWGLKEAGNSLSRNFSYRAFGAPPGRDSLYERGRARGSCYGAETRNEERGGGSFHDTVYRVFTE